MEAVPLLDPGCARETIDSTHSRTSCPRKGSVSCFLIPGFDETLRVNGTAVLSQAPADIGACTTERRAPKLVVRVSVEAAYLHCAKAFLRSKLWDASSLVDRSLLPTTGKMISDQTGIQVAPETREEMAKRYAPDL
jgi:hypothetical protein